MRCPICGKEGKENDTWTIRQLWLDAGGFGYIPPVARAHVRCNDKEMRQIKGKDREEARRTIAQQWTRADDDFYERIEQKSAAIREKLAQR